MSMVHPATVLERGRVYRVTYMCIYIYIYIYIGATIIEVTYSSLNLSSILTSLYFSLRGHKENILRQNAHGFICLGHTSQTPDQY